MVSRSSGILKTREAADCSSCAGREWIGRSMIGGVN